MKQGSREEGRLCEVVAWLLGRGEETLARHQTLADTLTGITRQEAEFHKFYTVATCLQLPGKPDLIRED
ncbi:hypothetical protein Pmani_022046 [Petrolisthes manimaculis]|uniref:Uncharacterized protein n=1 Tax=Petrolisthes manimaculis TaxID=1843537 RepID=A0AAE1U2I0_9EUCA|nr:hypothetical protein Pmani_022046 [Petrolisthes manimaculis]